MSASPPATDGPTSQPGPAPAEQPVIELRDVRKRFGGVTAVGGVSLTVDRGEVVALVGNNGAGKSTIMRMISGVHAPDAGEILISGTRVRFQGPREARAWGIEPVPQELALARHLSVTANIYLGREITRGWGPFKILNKRAMKARSRELIEGFGIDIPEMGARVFDMSGGQQQGVAIGRAMAWGGRLVVLDEPTAALGVRETARVEQTVRGLRGSGVAVLLVSHNLDQVFRVSDRIYVLRRGFLVGERVTAAARPEEVVSLITGLGGEGL
ncbi:MAG: ATP-binding cassette domain-containing protein [Acidimicrobiales bacterium]